MTDLPPDTLPAPPPDATDDGSAPARLVPRVATPVPREQLVAVLRAGHRLALGAAPSRLRLACGLAQVALENGWGSALYGYNFGNLTAGSSWAGDWNTITTSEQVTPGSWRPVAMRFRVYETSVLGAAGYWSELAERYASALEQMDAGDPAGQAHALKVARYYTADESKYAGILESIYPRCLAMVDASVSA